MPRYRVDLYRTIQFSEEASVYVDAEDEDNAMVTAYEAAGDFGEYLFSWTSLGDETASKLDDYNTQVTLLEEEAHA